MALPSARSPVDLGDRTLPQREEEPGTGGGWGPEPRGGPGRGRQVLEWSLKEAHGCRRTP